MEEEVKVNVEEEKLQEETSKENAASAEETFFAFNCIFTYLFLHTAAGIIS